MEGNLHFKIDWASLWWEGNLPFLLCFTLYSRANSEYKPPGGLIFGGAIYQRVFCVTILGGLYLEGLIHGGLIFRILRYVIKLCFFILCVECLNAPNFLLVSICVCMFPFLTEWSFSTQIFYTVLSDFCANLAKAHIPHVQWI